MTSVSIGLLAVAVSERCTVAGKRTLAKCKILSRVLYMYKCFQKGLPSLARTYTESTIIKELNKVRGEGIPS